MQDIKSTLLQTQADAAFSTFPKFPFELASEEYRSALILSELKISVDNSEKHHKGLEQTRHKRREHTLKRIKSKWYYADSMFNLCDTMLDNMNEDNSDKMLAQKEHVILACSEFASNEENRALSDDEWFTAIELGIALTDCETYCNEKVETYIPYIEKCIWQIWTALVLLPTSASSELTSFLQKMCIEQEKTIKKLEREISEISIREKNLKGIASEAQSSNNELREQLANLEKKVERLETREQKLLKALENAENKSRVEHRQGTMLTDANESVFSPQKGPDADNAEKSESTNRAESKTDTAARTEPCEISYSETDVGFPERVLFVGGSQSFVNRIKARHPDWTFVTMDDGLKAKSRPAVDMIVIYCKYLSHQYMRHWYAAVSDNIPRIYVTSTNLDIVDSEIKGQYARAIAKGPKLVKERRQQCYA